MANKVREIKAVIFDCDGTLIDSEALQFVAWQQALRERGGDLEWETYVAYAGKSAHEIARQFALLIGSEDAEGILASRRSHFHEIKKQGCPAIASTVEWVRKLAGQKEERGLQLGVASAARREEIFDHLERLAITHLFDVILSGQDDLAAYNDPTGVNKPKPYIYLHAAKLLDLFPHQCLVIEDSATGVAAAIAAGCPTIAVPNHCTRHQDLSAATLCLESLADFDLAQFTQEETP